MGLFLLSVAEGAVVVAVGSLVAGGVAVGAEGFLVVVVAVGVEVVFC